ncbi:MAG TPA: phosphotransferase, partial [Candidatus Dormibacteraeota bacterium]
DFHHQHTLIGEGGLVVIDLDEARAGDPAVDVAHFAANLRLLRLREGTAGGGDLEAAFLDAYAARTGYVPDRRHRWCHAYTCLKIARQLARGRGPAPAPAGPERERQVGLILDEGLRCPG